MKTRQFILSNFTAVTESQDFLCLDNQQVVEWICRNDVAVSTEDVIFKVDSTQQKRAEREVRRIISIREIVLYIA